MSEGGSCSRTWQTSTRLATELSFRRRRCWRRLGRNDPTAQLQPLLLPIALLWLQAAMSSKEMPTEVAVRQPRRRSSYGSRSPCHQGGKGSSIQIAAAPTTVTAFRGRRSGSTLVHPTLPAARCAWLAAVIQLSASTPSSARGAADTIIGVLCPRCGGCG